MSSEIISLDSFRHSERPKGPSFLSRPERLHIIHEKVGFFPQSNAEASSALSLIGREDSQNPVLEHLNEVYLRQRKYQADAPKTIRSFDAYAGNALNESAYMDTFAEMVEENQSHPLTSFENTFSAETWQEVPTLRAVFTALTRYHEVSEFARGGGSDTLGKQALIDNITDNDERIVRIMNSLGKKRMSGLARTAEAVKANQANRFEFWVTQLEQSRRHLFVRNVANTALAQLLGDAADA